MLRGVVLFCHAHKLLQLTAAHQVTEIIEWSEVFLEEGVGDSPDLVQHQQHCGRTFLLAIAIVRDWQCLVAVCVYICLFLCLSVCLSVCLFVCLSVSYQRVRLQVGKDVIICMKAP